ncbi:DNA polymerase theta [Trichinella pseudospiralis]|uniref:DNA polymerase theta n=1 Tax=Trichinella pseudospiralis TaxID=6337 RepID=A0A0V1JAA9_TRIPS|nr:DNA polymerase theta [Trichinella pseudospiralis]
MNNEDQALSELKDLDIPEDVVTCYNQLGIVKLFSWQYECLTLPGVLSEGANLVYSAPTSAGKTLVAEILLLKRVLQTRRRALFILPFVSVAREKMLYLNSVFRNVGVQVQGYMGTLNPSGGFHSWDVAVCTIEKANGLINRLVEEENVNCLSCVVVDELHIVNENYRGKILELLLTKLIHFNQKIQSEFKSNRIQLIAMSATLPNLETCAQWLGAKAFRTYHRPVPLTEYIFHSGQFFTKDGQMLRNLSENFILNKDNDNVIGLCLETVVQGSGVLIFCSTKVWCERLASLIADAFKELLIQDGWLSIQLKKFIYPDKQAKYIADFAKATGNVDSVLKKTLPVAVAFHHAGLTMEEREKLESGFRNGLVKVLVATTTLSSGVNLPAKRVIIRSLWGNPNGPNPALCLNSCTYKQMIGRAGRKGMDSEALLRMHYLELAMGQKGCILLDRHLIHGAHEFAGASPSADDKIVSGSGESILMCKSNELKRACELIANANMLENNSTLSVTADKSSSWGLIRTLLESKAEILFFLHCTLSYAKQEAAATSEEQCKNSDLVESCLQYLQKNDFISVTEDNILPTQLGCATVGSSMSPDEALYVYKDLKKAKSALVLETDLHLVTPIFLIEQVKHGISWTQYYDIWRNLESGQRRVGEMIGIQERYLVNKAASVTLGNLRHHDYEKLQIYLRYFVALALYELVEEKPIMVVSKKYGFNRGFLQSLQQQAATYAGMVIAFCDRLGWFSFKNLLCGFSERLAFGVKRDLTELVQIDGIDGLRARRFHEDGITTIAKLAQMKVREIAKVFSRAVPFESSNGGGEKSTWLAGHSELSLHDAAEFVRKQARCLLSDRLRGFGLCFIQSDEKESKILQNNIFVDLLEEDNSHNQSENDDAVLQLHTPQSASLEGNLKVKNTDDRSACVDKSVEKLAFHSQQNESTVSRSIVQEEKFETEGSLQVVPDRSAYLDEKAENRNWSNGNEMSSFSRSKILDSRNNIEDSVSNKSSFLTASNEEQMLNNDNACCQREEKSKCKNMNNSLQRALKTCSDENSRKTEDSISLVDEVIFDQWFSSPFLLNDDVIEAFAKNKHEDSFSSRNKLNNTIDDNQKLSASKNYLQSTSFRKTDKESDLNHEIEITEDAVENFQKNATAQISSSPTTEMEETISASWFDSPFLMQENLMTENQPDNIAAHKSTEKKSESFQRCFAECGTSVECSYGSSLLEYLEETFEGLSLVKSEVSAKDSRTNFSKQYEEIFLNSSLSSPFNCSAAEYGSHCSELPFDQILENVEQQTTGHDKQLTKAASVGNENKSDNFYNTPEVDLHQDFEVSLSWFNTSFEMIEEFSSRANECLQSSIEGDSSCRECTMAEILDKQTSIQKTMDSLFDEDLSFNKTCQSDLNLELHTGHFNNSINNVILNSSRNLDESSGKNTNNDLLKLSTALERETLNVLNTSFSSLTERPNIDCQLPVKHLSISEAERHQEFKDALQGLSTQQLVDIFDSSFDTKVDNISTESAEILAEDEFRSFTASKSEQQIQDFSENLPEQTATEYAVVNLEKSKETMIMFCETIKKQKQYAVSIVLDEDIENCTACYSKLHSRKSTKTSNYTVAVCWDLQNVYVLTGDGCEASEKDKVELLKMILTPSDSSKAFEFQNRLCLTTASWILNPDGSYWDVKALLTEYSPHDLSILQFSWNSDSSNSSTCCFQSAVTHVLYPKIFEILKKKDLWSAFLNVELPAQYVVGNIESAGIGFDIDLCMVMSSCLKNRLNELEAAAAKEAGHRFSLNSPKEVSKLPPPDESKVSRRRFTSVKQYSTAKHVLENLAHLHPLPGIILEFRQLSAALTNYIYPLLRINRYSCTNCNCVFSTEERIIGKYDWYTATGRLIMYEPNLQIVPKFLKIPNGNNILHLREIFVASEGCTLLSADFSQLELRILAHLSNDSKLIKILKGKIDVFSEIAAKMNSIDRSAICYALIYGMCPKSLAAELGIDEEQAIQFYNNFKKLFPDVTRWLTETTEKCRSRGFCVTLANRVRYFAAIRSSATSEKLHAERQAINTTVQGSASDIFKIALRKVYLALDEYTKKNDQMNNVQTLAKIIFQIHDELMLEVTNSNVEAVATIVKHSMETAVSLRVDLPVRIKHGNNWGTMTFLSV